MCALRKVIIAIYKWGFLYGRRPQVVETHVSGVSDPPIVSTSSFLDTLRPYYTILGFCFSLYKINPCGDGPASIPKNQRISRDTVEIWGSSDSPQTT